MLQSIGKIISIIVSTQLALASPTSTEIKAQQATAINEFHKVYNESSTELKTKGLKAFFKVYDGAFNEQDQAFLSGKLKGLNALPAISVEGSNRLEINNLVHGKNHPIRLEYASNQLNKFLVNGHSIEVHEIDSVEDLYKRVSIALDQKVSIINPVLWIRQLSDLAVPRAHATIDGQTLTIGAVILAATAVAMYYLGKKRGRDKTRAQDLAANAAAAAAANNGRGVISESNPTYLENPTTNSTSHTTDVITPVH